MKNLVIVLAIMASVKSVSASEIHTDKKTKEMACSKECYESIRHLWSNGTISLVEAQQLWINHKKK